MKIRYKLVAISIVITILAVFPVSIIQMTRSESEKISDLMDKGDMLTRFLSHTLTNIILATGADIETSRVDAGELFSSLKSYAGNDLVYAEAVFLSSMQGHSGNVLARYSTLRSEVPPDRFRGVSSGSISRMKQPWKWNGEIGIPGEKGRFYEFIAVGSVSGKPVCLCRVLYSKEMVLAPVIEMRKITGFIVAIAVTFVAFLGFVISRQISKPIMRLTEAAMKMDDGNFDISVPVRSRDEVGMLSQTFNHMLKLINLKIAELEESNRKLLELDAMKDEFLANTSHELKTPLYGIVGIAESLMRGASGPLNDGTRDNIRLIIASGKTLGNLVNDILDFSRMKHFDLDLNFQRIDMHDVAQFVLSITVPLAGNRNISIENNIEPDTMIVRGDDGRLQQILLNLVGNAVKFTENGFVRISADRCDEKSIVVNVSDSGIGIPDDIQEQIFEPFRQGDGSMTRRYGGTGLGLAITRKLVELHGGHLWFKSVKGEGTVFSFTINSWVEDATSITEKRKTPRPGTLLPFGKTHSVRTAVPADVDGKRHSRGKILVVDDEPINIMIVINHLLMEGYDIVTAENGEQVDSYFTRGEIPDLILLDVMLPRISGYDICRKIRENYSSHELPIVMLTVRQSTSDIVAGITAGANDYLVKPVNGDELVARVENLISLKNSVKIQSELRIIRNELDIAIELQKSILPAEVPSVDGLVFAARFIPSSNVSGDFYDFSVKQGGTVGVIIADVAGHGVPAAMVASMMQMAYGSIKNRLIEPSEILTHINSILSAYPDGVYLTSSCIVIDPVNRTLRYSTAGHPPFYIHHRTRGEVTGYAMFGRPIGVFDDSVYTDFEVQLVPGDRIILYTDGIIEANGDEKIAFGNDRFKDVIAQCGALDVESFINRIVSEVSSWSGVAVGESLKDDVTVVVIDVNDYNV